MAGCILLYVIHSKMWPLNPLFFFSSFYFLSFGLFIYFPWLGNGFQHVVALSRAHQLASLKSLKHKINQGTKGPRSFLQRSNIFPGQQRGLEFPRQEQIERKSFGTPTLKVINHLYSLFTFGLRDRPAINLQ